MYTAKIPGTKYIAALETVQGQWVVRLKLDDVVEAEAQVPQMNKRAIHTSLGELFLQVNLQINAFQHDLIHQELASQISHLIQQDPTDSSTAPVDDTPKEDPRVDDLIKKLDELENYLKMLEDRVERMEALSPK